MSSLVQHFSTEKYLGYVISCRLQWFVHPLEQQVRRPQQPHRHLTMRMKRMRRSRKWANGRGGRDGGACHCGHGPCCGPCDCGSPCAGDRCDGHGDCGGGRAGGCCHGGCRDDHERHASSCPCVFSPSCYRQARPCQPLLPMQRPQVQQLQVQRPQQPRGWARRLAKYLAPYHAPVPCRSAAGPC